MENENRYQYKMDDGIVIQYFKGPVNIDDIISSWDNLFRKEIVHPGLKGVISDFTGAGLDIEMKDLLTMREFLLKNSKLVKSLCLAQVVDSPKIVMPLYFENENPEFTTRGFSTLEAAKMWILDSCP